MKLVIEIDENKYHSICDDAESHDLKNEIKNGTVFPEGKWIKNYDKDRKWDRLRFYCSNCGRWQTYGESKYCLNCGAKMEREDKGCR